jgi:energy-converting hydrogenase Eha subunit E
LVLASQFESFLQPLAIMLSLPLSMIGVFLAMLATRGNMNMMTMIGVIMLMGMVTKNAILLIDNANQRRGEGLSREEALITAGEIRLRPIVMTTLAMIFGMLPLAMALGEGSEFRSPMARAVIGGLISSTLLTLVVVPVVYTYLDGIGTAISRLFGSGSHPEKHPESAQVSAAQAAVSYGHIAAIAAAADEPAAQAPAGPAVPQVAAPVIPAPVIPAPVMAAPVPAAPPVAAPPAVAAPLTAAPAAAQSEPEDRTEMSSTPLSAAAGVSVQDFAAAARSDEAPRV